MTTNNFIPFLWRITSLHMITYFMAGVLAMFVFNYKEAFVTGALKGFMQPLDTPMVALGPALQFFRGFIFAVVLWPFKSIFLSRPAGWAKLWLLFVGLGILSTFGPAPGSIDGMIYTMVPVTQQLHFLPELLFQSLLLSLGIYYWSRKPLAAYNYIAIALVALIILLGIAGYQAAGMDVN